MLGPVDLDDWQYDRRDELSLMLRRHPIITGIARGADPTGRGAPPGVRGPAGAFAAQGFLPVSCGARPLRTETALAVLKGQFDLLRARRP